MNGMQRDHFERLGLPRRFALNEAELERNYLIRSQELHPDHHQSGSTAQQRASLELTAQLNEAAHVLRDPFRRGEYLLQLYGGPTASEQKEMPADFLEEMLDLRMEIEELRESGERDSAAFKQMEASLCERRLSMIGELERRFDSLPNEEAQRRTVLSRIRSTLNALKYVQNLLRDLRQ